MRLAGRVLRALFLAAALGLLVLALVRQGPAVGRGLARVGPVAATESFALVLAGLLASAFVWRAMLTELGGPLPVRPALHVFFLGQLGKYLPGSVFAVAAQMELGRDQGVRRSRVAAAGALFMALLTVSGLLVAVAALALAGSGVWARGGWLLAALPLLVLLLLPPVLSRALGLLLRLARRPPLDRPLSWRGVGGGLGWSLVMWACYGGHLLVLVLPQPHRHPGHLLLLCLGGYALAWTVGFLVLVAPAGAGVREATLVLVLAPALAHPAGTAVAVLSRGLMTGGDLVWGLVGAALRPRVRRPDHPDRGYPPD